MYARRLPYHGMVTEKKDKKTTLYLSSCLSFPPPFRSRVVFLITFYPCLVSVFLMGHPYFKKKFYKNFFLLGSVVLFSLGGVGLQTNI